MIKVNKNMVILQGIGNRKELVAIFLLLWILLSAVLEFKEKENMLVCFLLAGTRA